MPPFLVGTATAVLSVPEEETASAASKARTDDAASVAGLLEGTVVFMVGWKEVHCIATVNLTLIGAHVDLMPTQYQHSSREQIHKCIK